MDINAIEILEKRDKKKWNKGRRMVFNKCVNDFYINGSPRFMADWILSRYNEIRHKSTLPVPGKMSVLSGSTCNCNFLKTLPNLTLPFLTKVNIPGPNPAGRPLDLAQPGATLLQPILTCCQITNLTNFKSYQNLVNIYFGTVKVDLCLPEIHPLL